MGRRGGEQEGKSRAAKRTVVLLAELAPILREHLLRTGSRGDDLVFGVSASAPFEPTTVRRRALSAWRAANKRLGEGEAPMRPIGLQRVPPHLREHADDLHPGEPEGHPK
jgi:hypothetical protein